MSMLEDEPVQSVLYLHPTRERPLNGDHLMMSAPPLKVVKGANAVVLKQYVDARGAIEQGMGGR